MTANSLSELKSISDEDLVLAYDREAKRTAVGINFYLEEIRYREATKLNQRVERLTRLMTVLTVIITIATILNVAVFLNDSPAFPSFLP